MTQDLRGVRNRYTHRASGYMAAFRAYACDYRREGILNDSRFDLLPLELQLANAITPPECVHLRQRLGADDGQVQTSLGGHLATASTPNQQGMRG